MELLYQWLFSKTWQINKFSNTKFEHHFAGVLDTRNAVFELLVLLMNYIREFTLFKILQLPVSNYRKELQNSNCLN